MSPILITLILSAVSCLLITLCRFVRFLGQVCGVLSLIWLAAAIPVLFFLNIAWEYVLLFYLISATFGLILIYGGKKA